MFFTSETVFFHPSILRPATAILVGYSSLYVTRKTGISIVIYI